MFAIVNRTPLSVALIPSQDAQGRDVVTLLIKGSFRFGQRGVLPELEEEQAPIVWADEYLGRPGESSVAIEAETSPPAGATDVALVGQAYAGRKPRAVVDVGLHVGPLGKRLRVHGERVWRRRLGTFGATNAEPFMSLPLAYEHAYGGRDESHKDPARHACEQRNPVGRGFIAPGRGAQVEGVALPNIEDPDHEIRKPDDRPAPAGFGLIARSWQPRLGFAGTYDETWKRERAPLLPHDFDTRFYSAAHPDLIARPALTGGEVVRAEGVAEAGILEFPLPRLRFGCWALLDGKHLRVDVSMERVLIEPDRSRLSMNWKGTIACPRKILLLEAVTVTTTESTVLV